MGEGEFEEGAMEEQAIEWGSIQRGRAARGQYQYTTITEIFNESFLFTCIAL
jgi:hypothetical protein